MLVVGNTIVSDDVRDKCFKCNLSQCKGACCVLGDEGAPIEKEEESLLKTLLPKIKPYMQPQSVQIIEKEGLAYTDT